MIKLENVSKFYKTETSVAVGMQKINLEFKLGEFVAITGESGSGKSTLLNVISGIDVYEEGEIYINGEETSHYTIADWEEFRSKNIGFIFQNYNIIDSYTVLQNVMLALEVQGYEKRKIKKRAIELIKKVGLKSHLHHKASKLSGGQKQRCAIARALAKDCPILIADEPTGNLDSKSGDDIIKLLHEVGKDKLVIIVTHNYSQVEKFVTRKIRMHDGSVVEDKKISDVSAVTNNTMQRINRQQKIGFFTLTKIALRNLFATPKRFVFSMFVQIVIMTSLILIYANQVKSIRTKDLIFYYNNFSFQTENLVILNKYDNSVFTESEINKFKSLDKVLYVAPYITTFLNEITLNDISLQITPAEIYKQENLLKGNLPKNKNQILLSEKFEKLYNTNQTIVFNLKIKSNDFIEKQFEVVGIIKDALETPKIAFSSEFFYDKEFATSGVFNNFLIQALIINENGITETTEYFNRKEQIKINNNLSDDEIGFYNGSNFKEYNNYKINLKFRTLGEATFNNYNLIKVSNSEFTPDDEYYYYYYLFMNQNVYDTIMNTLMQPKFLTLIASDFHDAKSIVSSINNKDYKIIYPYLIENLMTQLSSFFRTIFAVIIIIVAGLFGYAIIHWMLKNVMQTKKRDFAIFRSIGAKEKTLAWLVVLEQLVVGLISFIITVGILTVLRIYVLSVADIFRFIAWYDIVLLFVILIGFSVMLGFKFNKKIFKQSVINTLN